MGTIGERIRALRLKHGWSQQQMADRLGMTRAGYGNIELGRSQPPADRIQDIAALFQVTPGALFPKRLLKRQDAEEPVHVS